MKTLTFDIPGLFELRPDVYGDERGYFLETFNENVLRDACGFDRVWVQDNESCSGKHILRGLHYQLPPFAQAKLVRVVRGAALDVVVDLRMDSPTFGQHAAVELRGDLKNQLLIPRGFAHGFMTLEADTIFCYKCDQFYQPDHERVMQWNDPELGIQWPVAEPTVSEKDQNGTPFLDSSVPFLLSDS
ncbi:MAG: dTDP-4-dehydrorhamnose 3,5-epimerase [Flavobacteriales bacterium]|nr:dTDP-4-dehydrorhamnose 3,5-epimerase [Flavobacteriales bacterium]